ISLWSIKLLCYISLMALVFWRNYPPAIIGTSLLLYGDGMAEVVGKTIGRIELITPWGKKKTLEGSLAVFIFGGIGAFAMCYLLFHQIYFFYSTLFAFVGMLVEFYSYPEYDNVFIPLSSVILGFFLF
ncbi:phosphatidate cytidylyltransferase, putative, partial [Entamoeba invadens IP1]